MGSDTTSFKLARTTGFSAFRFIRNYWYWIIIILVILPTIITSVKTGIETKNYAYPFIQLGSSLLSSDAVLYEKVEMIKTDPNTAIGMEKPEGGLWNNFKYYWHIGKFIWIIFGLLYLISFPFIMVHKIILKFNTSHEWGAIWKTAWITLLFMFIMNLFFLIYKIGIEETTFLLPEGTSMFTGVWKIILMVVPFHGVINLASYILSLF